MKTTNPFIASVADQSGEMVELIPQDSQTIAADERLREAAQAVIKSADEFAAWIALGTPARYLVTSPNQAEASRAMDALRAALNQGQG